MFALILEKHAPTLRGCVSDRYTPWLNADEIKRAEARDELKTQAVKSNSKFLMKLYYEIRNRLDSLNIQINREYFSDRIPQFQGDLKKLGKPSTKLLTKS